MSCECWAFESLRFSAFFNFFGLFLRVKINFMPYNKDFFMTFAGISDHVFATKIVAFLVVFNNSQRYIYFLNWDYWYSSCNIHVVLTGGKIGWVIASLEMSSILSGWALQLSRRRNAFISKPLFLRCYLSEGTNTTGPPLRIVFASANNFVIIHTKLIRIFDSCISKFLVSYFFNLWVPVLLIVNKRVNVTYTSFLPEVNDAIFSSCVFCVTPL